MDFRLRPLREDDAPALVRYADNVRVWNNVRDYFPHPYRLTDAQAFIAISAAKNPVTEFAIEVDGEAVGVIGYVPQTDVERVSAEVGYWIGEPFWGKGIMPAALRELTGKIFAETEIRRLFAPVFEYNHASMRVLEKAGFEKKTIFRQAAVKNGKVIDLHYYELSR